MIDRDLIEGKFDIIRTITPILSQRIWKIAIKITRHSNSHCLR